MITLISHQRSLTWKLLFSTIGSYSSWDYEVTRHMFRFLVSEAAAWALKFVPGVERASAVRGLVTNYSFKKKKKL